MHLRWSILGGGDATSIKAELLLLDPNPVEGEKDFGKTYEFITAEDLESEWEKCPKAKLVFRVRAQDSLSGFAKVFSKDFYTRDDIVAGRFAEGGSMNIGPNPSL